MMTTDDDKAFVNAFPNLEFGTVYENIDSESGSIFVSLITLMRSDLARFAAARNIKERIAIVFVEKNEFGAYATKQNDMYFIIINTGTVFVMWNLINIIYGTATPTCKDEFINNKQKMQSDFCDIMCPFEENEVPNWVFIQGCMWVYLHERAHIANGHVDYLFEHLGRYSIKTDAQKALDRRTVEFDADAHAINITFEASIFDPNAKSISSRLAEKLGIDDTGAELALAGTLHVKLIFAWLDHEWSYEDIALSHYPPASKRSTYATATIEAVCISAGLNFQAYTNVNILAGVAVSVQMRDIFMRQPFPYWRFETASSLYRHDPVIDILENWAKMRPILTELKLTNQELARVANDD